MQELVDQLFPDGIQVIAESTVVFEHPNGDRVPGRIYLGKPEFCTEDPEKPRAWFCVHGSDGLFGAFPIGGFDSMQALDLSLKMLRTKIEVFREKGGRVLYPDGEEEFGIL